MHRVLFLSVLTLWACQDPSKLDEGDTAAPSDASPTTEPTGATDAVYTVSFALASAAARAGDPVTMARAMAGAIEAGRAGFEANPMERRDMAVPSTPLLGLAELA